MCFQVRSRDISIEEWKGSETYSPDTAYGKTPALTPPAGAAALRLPPGDPPDPSHSILARHPVPSSSFLFPSGGWGGVANGPLEKGGHLAGEACECTDPAVPQVWTSWCP